MIDTYSNLLPTYCFHCGKIIKLEDTIGLGNIHKKCQVERQRIIYSLKKERWSALMKNPAIRDAIAKVDAQIINKSKQR